MRNKLTLITPLLLGLLGSQVEALADSTNVVETTPLAGESERPLIPEGGGRAVDAAQQERIAAPTPSPQSRRQLLEELRALPPSEREARLQELRKQHGLPTLSPEMQKRREELLKLTPEERRAKIEELRRSRPVPPVDEKVRAQRRAALEQKLEALRARKAAGSLSPEEQKLLERLEQAKRLLDGQTAPMPPNSPRTRGN